ncbi:MAG: hypothetical protein ACKVPX_14840 [Myxococcaceae bacterium]
MPRQGVFMFRVGLLAAVAFFGSGCAVRYYTPGYRYYSPAAAVVSYSFGAAHPIPSGGWCNFDYGHNHAYAPTFEDYTLLNGNYYYANEPFYDASSFYYYDYHPLPTGGFCNTYGRHFHDWGPSGAWGNQYSWDRGRRGYVYRGPHAAGPVMPGPGMGPRGRNHPPRYAPPPPGVGVQPFSPSPLQPPDRRTPPPGVGAFPNPDGPGRPPPSRGGAGGGFAPPPMGSPGNGFAQPTPMPQAPPVQVVRDITPHTPPPGVTAFPGQGHRPELPPRPQPMPQPRSHPREGRPEFAPPPMASPGNGFVQTQPAPMPSAPPPPPPDRVRDARPFVPPPSAPSFGAPRGNSGGFSRGGPPPSMPMSPPPRMGGPPQRRPNGF